MASISRARRTTDERSGGKIVRNRRIAAPRTPYDRPVPAASVRAPPQNPNWLTGLVVPTSRMIATGATKLLYSIFGPDTSSSSSSSSSGSGSSMEDDIDGENDYYHVPPDGVDGLSKNGTISELIDCSRKEPQLSVGMSETKRFIEKLLMQETFSRDEGDRLIKVINSRVVDGSTIEGEHGRLETLDLCSKAVMEAKQWLEEKKVVSGSKSNLDHENCALNSGILSQGTRGASSSPIDMAKSYMRARPAWASPSINYGESRTPSPIGTELWKDETPPTVTGNSFSSSKKIYSLASGSWNIDEELRKVRSKATEDLLKTPRSTKIDLSPYALEPRSCQKLQLPDKTQLGGRDKYHNLNSLAATKSIQQSVDVAAGNSTVNVLPGSIEQSVDLAAGNSTVHALPASVLEMTQNDSLNEDWSAQPVASSSARNQELQTIRTLEGEDHAASKSCQPTIPDLCLEHGSRLSDRNCSSAKEETELRGKSNGNGFPLSGSSLSAGDVEPNFRPSDDRNPNSVGSSHDKLASNNPMEETCELLSEASMEVPNINENNMGEELLQPEPTQLNPQHGLAEKTTNVAEKQRGRKVGRYSRKSRGKG